MNANRKRVIHEPVMVREVVKFLHIKRQACYIDATLGAGSHTLEILKKGGLVLGIDYDPQMLSIAKRRIENFIAKTNSLKPNCYRLVCGNYKYIDRIAIENGFGDVQGIIFDLGVSSVHFDSKNRGFSFKRGDEILDMRLNPLEQAVTAADLINVLREDQLVNLFGEVFNNLDSKRISQEIVKSREGRKIEKVKDLIKLAKNVVRSDLKHPATKLLLALRMAVNNEIDNLREALPKAYTLLKSKGRMVVISFHSGEDTLVKNFLKVAKDNVNILTKKPITPSLKEIKLNPRARSAKMRVLEKI